MIGKYFLDRCFETPVEKAPWPYQIIKDTLPLSSFSKLKKKLRALPKCRR